MSVGVEGMKTFRLRQPCCSSRRARGRGRTNRTTYRLALTIDPPTLMALGFAWNIEGDDNRNARVAVNFRKKGTDK